MTNTTRTPMWLIYSPMGVLLFALALGCGGGSHDDHDHDHAVHESHNETGEQGDWDVEVSEGNDHDHEGHGGHHHDAPHGGALIALGDHFAHIEVIHDATEGTVTVYLLDGGAEDPVRVEHESIELKITEVEFEGSETKTVNWEPITLDAMANPLTGETVGDTSEFRGGSTFLVGPITGFRGTLQKVSMLGSDLENIGIQYPEGNEE